jgi:hypothetical protein
MAFNQNQLGSKSSYGYAGMNTGNWTGTTSFSFTTGFKELTGLSHSFTLASPSPDFAMTTDGRLKYTGTNTRVFLCSAACYASILSGAIGMVIQIRKNGSAVTGAQAYYQNSAALIEDFPISLDTNDYISIFVATASNQSAPVLQANIAARYVGDA